MSSVNRDLAKSMGAANSAGTLTSTGEVTGSSSIVVVTTADSLPSSGNAGDRAFVDSDNRYYIHSGSGWYNIALINNTPTITSIVDGFGDSIQSNLDVDNDSSYSVILTATDPENVPVTFSATTDSDFSGIATLSQNGGTFTINTLTSDSATTDEGNITFRATDGVNVATAIRSIATFNTIDDGFDTNTSTASHYSYTNSGGGQSMVYNSTYGFLDFTGADNHSFDFYWEPGGKLPSSGYLWLNLRKDNDYPNDNNGFLAVGRRTYNGSSYSYHHKILAGICGSAYQQSIYVRDDANATEYGSTNVPYRWNTESSYVNFYLVYTPTSAKLYVNSSLNVSTTWTTSQYDIAANGGLNYARWHGSQIDMRMSRIVVGSGDPFA